MLDAMASRYHRLPSELIDRATTFDLLVLETALAYHKSRDTPSGKPTPNVKQQDLKAMLEAVRSKRGS